MNIYDMDARTLIEKFNEMAESLNYSERLYGDDFADYISDNYTIKEFWEMIDHRKFDLDAPYFMFDGYEITSFVDDYGMKEVVAKFYDEELLDYMEED